MQSECMILVCSLFIVSTFASQTVDTISPEDEFHIDMNLKMQTYLDKHALNSTIHESKLYQRTLKEQPFYFVKALKSLFSFTPSSLQKTTISQADKCIKNLKLEDKLENKTENNWTCKVLQDKITKLDLICGCFYEYDCSETRRFHFSSQYNKELEAVNRLNNINRGADFQCERHLIKKTKSAWSCSNERNQAFSNADDELYCMCMRPKTCKHDRYYELD